MDGRPLTPEEDAHLRERLPQLSDDLVREARHVTMEAWAERELEGDLVLILEGHGQLLELSAARDIGPGAAVIDSLTTSVANGRFSRLRPTSAMEAIRVPLGQEPPVALLEVLAKDWERWFDDFDRHELDELRSLHDRLNEDGSIKPGPYQLKGTRLILAALDLPAWPARKPLRAIGTSDAATLLVIADYPRVVTPGAKPMIYREAALFAPRMLPRLPFPEPCVEAAWIYPDDRMATLLGRELYGLPKRVGRVTIRDRFVEVRRTPTWFRFTWEGHTDLHDAQAGAEVLAAVRGGQYKATRPFGLLEWRRPPTLLPSFMAAWRSHPSSTASMSQLCKTAMWTKRIHSSVRLEGPELWTPPDPKPAEGRYHVPDRMGRHRTLRGVRVRAAWRFVLDLSVADGERLR